MEQKTEEGAQSWLDVFKRRKTDPKERSAVASYSDDCPLAQELDRDDRLNFSEMPTIKRANRTWQDFADAERGKQRLVKIPFLTKGPEPLPIDEELKWAGLAVFWVVLLVLLLAIVVLITTPNFNIWPMLGLLTAALLGAVVYMFRLHRHLRGAWRWYRQKDESCPPIKTAETVDFLLAELPESQPSHDQKKSFGSLIDLTELNAGYKLLRDYKKMLESSQLDIKKAAEASLDLAGYREADSEIARRCQRVQRCLIQAGSEIDKAYKVSETLRDTLLPRYKIEAAAVSSLLAKLRWFHVGKDDILIRDIEQELKSSRDDIVEKFGELLQALATARQIINQKLEEHKLHEGRLQPLPKTNDSDSDEPMKRPDSTGSGIEQG